MGYKCAADIVRWSIELHFYWQADWNFALPPPGHKTLPSNEPLERNYRTQIIFGWPLSILSYGALCFAMFRLAKLFWKNDPSLKQSRPSRRSGPFWLLIALLVAAFATGVLVWFISPDQNPR